MDKEIYINISGKTVTATEKRICKSSSCIADSESDHDIFETVGRAVDDIFREDYEECQYLQDISAVVVVGDKAYHCYGSFDIETLSVGDSAGKPKVFKRKFTLVEV